MSMVNTMCERWDVGGYQCEFEFAWWRVGLYEEQRSRRGYFGAQFDVMEK